MAAAIQVPSGLAEGARGARPGCGLRPPAPALAKKRHRARESRMSHRILTHPASRSENPFQWERILGTLAMVSNVIRATSDIIVTEIEDGGGFRNKGRSPVMDRSVFVQSGAHPVAGILFGGFATVALLLFPGTAAAAPQSLGLVATAQPVPMICDQGGCVAQLSSFCLQRERRPPGDRTPYHVASGAGLWLHLTDADGGHRRVPAEGFARLVSSRGYAGIEAQVSSADMAVLGAVEISLEVGRLVTLFPESVADDPNPITAAEGVFATGPARHLAADIFDAPGAFRDTINILDRAINSVTTSARLSDEGRRDLWSRVAGRPLDAALDRRTRGAAEVFSACLDELRQWRVGGLRDCLAGRRDHLLIGATVRLWNALAAGS